MLRTQDEPSEVGVFPLRCSHPDPRFKAIYHVYKKSYVSLARYVVIKSKHNQYRDRSRR